MSSNNALTFEALKSAVSGSACAFRCRTELQPAGGTGDKVFPPTYAGAVYAKEKRRVPGREQPVDCVLLDSVQAQANRMEEALQAAVDNGRLAIPVIKVDFSDADKNGLLTPIGKVTSLQAPHRVADAILRDSLADGVPFRQTADGKRLDAISLSNATALYELCPTALIFGMWDSTGPKGGGGAKFQRAMVSEIVGIDVVYGVKTSSRIDPLQIARNAGPLYRSNGQGGGIGWTLDESKAAQEKKAAAKLGKDGRPSEANHGNIVPSLSPIDQEGMPLAGGVTIASAEQAVTLSLPALRRLQFPINGTDEKKQREVNAAGRTVLAALGLCAAALAAEKGFDLRSRCLLWPTDVMEWELLDRPGQPPSPVTLDADTAIGVLKRAVAEAGGLGLTWRTEPFVLKPAPQLVDLVEKSQALAAASGAEEGDE